MRSFVQLPRNKHCQSVRVDGGPVNEISSVELDIIYSIHFVNLSAPALEKY